jgi:transcriptional regulator with XRE-family HTH domain
MKKLSELRLDKGMTQEELATATGISLRTIQRIELGQVKPRAYSLKKIAEALNVDFSDLHHLENVSMKNLSNFFKGDSKQVFIGVFYSCWASIIFILLLLNCSSQILGIQFLSNSILFDGDFHVIRFTITLACVFALIQIYLLFLRKQVLSSVSYWILLSVFSALPMYLKFTNNFVDTSYFTLNNIQFYISFICWLILLFLGVTYKSLFNIPTMNRPLTGARV